MLMPPPPRRRHVAARLRYRRHGAMRGAPCHATLLVLIIFVDIAAITLSALRAIYAIISPFR